MAGDTPFDYGICVGDAGAWTAALAVLGFEPESAADPETPTGAPLATLRHPATGQRIRLYPREGPPPDRPAEGDVTIGIPVQGDPHEVLQALRDAAPSLPVGSIEDMPKEKGVAVILDGQRLILTTKRDPFTVVHYSASDWEEVLEFYESVLGFCFFPLPDRGNAVRTRLENAPGRVDLEASPDTPARTSASTRYFRLANAKLDKAEENLPGSRHGRWIEPPRDGRAWIEGPAGEVMEVVGRAQPEK